MFMSCFKKTANIICSWKKKKQTNPLQTSHNIKGSSVENASVVTAPDGIAAVIFFEAAFQSHIKS